MHRNPQPLDLARSEKLQGFRRRDLQIAWVREEGRSLHGYSGLRELRRGGGAGRGVPGWGVQVLQVARFRELMKDLGEETTHEAWEVPIRSATKRESMEHETGIFGEKKIRFVCGKGKAEQFLQ